MAAYGEIVKIFTPSQIFQKLNIQSKKCKCKTCSELNFLQKSQWARMYTSPPGVELGGSKDLRY